MVCGGCMELEPKWLRWCGLVVCGGVCGGVCVVVCVVVCLVVRVVVCAVVCGGAR